MTRDEFWKYTSDGDYRILYLDDGVVSPVSGVVGAYEPGDAYADRGFFLWRTTRGLSGPYDFQEIAVVI